MFLNTTDRNDWIVLRLLLLPPDFAGNKTQTHKQNPICRRATISLQREALSSASPCTTDKLGIEPTRERGTDF